MKKLWMRAGVSLMLTDEEIDEILGGCEGSAGQGSVVRALREGRFTFDGDSYIYGVVDGNGNPFPPEEVT